MRSTPAFAAVAAILTLALAAVAAPSALAQAQARTADDKPDLAQAAAQAIERAGANAGELRSALERTPESRRAAMRFLIAHMPKRDLESLKADFLVENVDYAYQAREAAPWGKAIPEAIFFNDVLPYANINERREPWRKEFFERFFPLVKDAKSASHAAAILNQNIFKTLNVKYSTKRPKADQSPMESIRAGLASCTGLSVLLADACRATGVPARLVGTPLWSDMSGNHTWIEVWDNGWHFTGAAEPTGDALDQAWFLHRSSAAKRDHPAHAIYAASFKPTPQRFPMVWARNVAHVYAVNVTDRYVDQAKPLPEGHARVMVRVLDGSKGERVSARVLIKDSQGRTVFEGKSNDERFDSNDHLTIPLRIGQSYQLTIGDDPNAKTTEIQVGDDPNGRLITIRSDARSSQ